MLVVLSVALVGRRGLTRAAAIAVAFGIVFANPLGVVATQATTDQRPLTPSAHADTSIHWVRVAGIPVAWYVPYDQKRPFAFENSPTSDLKLRYGFSLLPSTGASTVVPQCGGSIDFPCWRGRPDDYPLVQEDGFGNTWIVPLSQDILPNSRLASTAYVHVPQFHEVGLGLASKRALLYWLVILFLLGVAAIRSRVRWSRVGIAAAGSVGVGALLALILAAIPEHSRGTTSQPTLLPLPADAPDVVGRIEPRPIERYADDCIVRRSDGLVVNRCSRVGDFTAAETRNGIFAVWTGEAEGSMHLWGRSLSSAGEPLGLRAVHLHSWSQTSGDGTRNCETPADLQAAQLPRGEVLIAWSNSCGINLGGDASITGIVVDERGSIVRSPFVVGTFPQDADGLPPSFWLRSTTAGEAFLLWEGQSTTAFSRTYNSYGGAVFLSNLDDRHEAGDGRELVADAEHGIGSIAMDCDASCVLARGSEGTITVLRFGGTGVEHVGSVADGTAPVRSDLVAAAVAERYFVGWLESDGVNETSRIASFEPGEVPTVATGARDVPNGDGSRPASPRPLGIAVDRATPALVWQTASDFDPAPEVRLHLASADRSATYAVEIQFGAPVVTTADVLVALGGLWSVAPSEPVSVVLP